MIVFATCLAAHWPADTNGAWLDSALLPGQRILYLGFLSRTVGGDMKRFLYAFVAIVVLVLGLGFAYGGGPRGRAALSLSKETAFMILASLVAAALLADPTAPVQDERLRAIYKELVEINTVDPTGDNTRAAEAMAARLRAAGFPAADVQVLAPAPGKGNLVARLRGTGARRPLLLLAHLDVVEARREDWTTDPFTLIEKDGYFYGRGTSDDKAMAAIWIATLIRLREESYRPDRDIIVALTADEETGPANGVSWLVKTHRDLIDAELALNEGAGGRMQGGRNRPLRRKTSGASCTAPLERPSSARSSGTSERATCRKTAWSGAEAPRWRS